MKRIFAVLSLVLLAAFAFPSTVMAGGLYDGKVIFGTDFTLESGETLDGELLVFGGSVTMEPESRVTGDVVLFGGNVTSDGEIEGNLAVLGGNVQKQEGAQILGQEVSETSFDIPFDFHWVGPDIRWPSLSPASLAGQGLWFLFRCFMLAALAMLVILFLPEPTKRVAAAVVEQPLMAGGLGLLTAILTPIVLILLVVFIITIPLAILLVFAVIVAVLFGWIAIGLEVGHRLADIFKWDLHPAAAAGLGTFLFSVVVLGIGFVPCVGWTAQVIVSFLATGAILLTRFGSLSYSFKSASTPTDALEVQDAPEADKTDEADEG
jgi:hypothetical protein